MKITLLNRKHTFILALLCISMSILSACHNEARQCETPVNIIFDTDIGNDIDDAEALALLNLYMDDAKINLLGICLNKEGKETVGYVDLMNTFYGHTDIPLARARDNGGDGPAASGLYTGQVCALEKNDGTALFPVTGADYETLPDGHVLYRKLLASQPDSSVTIVSVGFLTNLARLLDTPADEYSPLAGKELVAKKVKLLSIMAARFDSETPEYNVLINIPAARKIFEEWPGRIVSIPWEIGRDVRYPAESMENDFGWVEAHPLKEAYVRYSEMPYDNWMFDPAAVVYAVEGGKYFTASGSGTIKVDDNGVTTFSSSPDGLHSYLYVTEEQADTLRNYFMEHLTRKPACLSK